ncbi:hypothetical protein BDK51DRAFT_45683 [Blyttiomyces helicus]|uniref:Uncharacterized protein n=1 Tax=Blyttiomyces helicus TaxID=388810 RepID=A0A4P9WJ92_9FUNG|nr:hypothetical protein BDK51DRAFT_45683 [Blyttiomyces helicus]|eukprot:RKO92003.1 hypothetical protein BDK51DRAFT_45683 [Blyttiomyces helicus]
MRKVARTCYGNEDARARGEEAGGQGHTPIPTLKSRDEPGQTENAPPLIVVHFCYEYILCLSSHEIPGSTPGLVSILKSVNDHFTISQRANERFHSRRPLADSGAVALVHPPTSAGPTPFAVGVRKTTARSDMVSRVQAGASVLIDLNVAADADLSTHEADFLNQLSTSAKEASTSLKPTTILADDPGLNCTQQGGADQRFHGLTYLEKGVMVDPLPPVPSTAASRPKRCAGNVLVDGKSMSENSRRRSKRCTTLAVWTPDRYRTRIPLLSQSWLLVLITPPPMLPTLDSTSSALSHRRPTRGSININAVSWLTESAATVPFSMALARWELGTSVPSRSPVGHCLDTTRGWEPLSYTVIENFKITAASKLQCRITFKLELFLRMTEPAYPDLPLRTSSSEEQPDIPESFGPGVAIAEVCQSTDIVHSVADWHTLLLDAPVYPQSQKLVAKLHQLEKQVLIANLYYEDNAVRAAMLISRSFVTSTRANLANLLSHVFADETTTGCWPYLRRLHEIGRVALLGFSESSC